MRKRIYNFKDCPDVTPRTREILSEERWYGNGPPHWLVGRKQGPAQTAHEAHDGRRKVVKRLRRYAASHPGAEALPDRLDSCAPGQRCMSGACSECNRAFARWFVASTAALLGDVE